MTGGGMLFAFFGMAFILHSAVGTAASAGGSSAFFVFYHAPYYQKYYGAQQGNNYYITYIFSNPAHDLLLLLFGLNIINSMNAATANAAASPTGEKLPT